jgi:hypothetical protein
MRATRTERALLVAALVALAVVLAAGSPQAGEADSATFFAEGRKLRLDGRCAEAVVRFQHALEAWPEGLGALRNIAECEVELGRYASARRSWWELRARVLKSGDDKYKGWADHAKEQHDKLAPLVGKLVIEVEGPGAAQADVWIDGEAIDAKLFGTDLERDVGQHRVEAREGGKVIVSRDVALEEGGRRVVKLDLPATVRPPPPPPGWNERPSDTGPRPLVVAGVVSLVVGGLGAAGTIAAVVVRQGALADLESTCPAYASAPCGPEAADPSDRGKTASLLVNVFGGITAAGVALGTTLLVVDLVDEGGGATALEIGPAGATLRVRF